MKLRYTSRALAELDDIFDYLEQRSPQGAKRVQRRLKEIADLVRERPYIGQKTNEGGVRRLVATPYPYVIFFKAIDNEVVIIGIRHGARDPRAAPRALEK